VGWLAETVKCRNAPNERGSGAGREFSVGDVVSEGETMAHVTSIEGNTDAGFGSHRRSRQLGCEANILSIKLTGGGVARQKVFSIQYITYFIYCTFDRL
jgi:hypothetical protein